MEEENKKAESLEKENDVCIVKDSSEETKEIDDTDLKDVTGGNGGRHIEVY